jgi:hypothetical protein
MKKYIIAALIGPLVIYGVTAFIQWDWNPPNWSMEARAATATFGLFAAFVACLITAHREDEL